MRNINTIKIRPRIFTENSSITIREIKNINKDTIETIMSSHLLGEGVYGFENISNSDFTENYLVTPSCFREDVGMETTIDFNHLLNDINNIYCYNIFLKKPSFLPLYTKDSLSLMQGISLLKSSELEIITQLLFTKRNDKWRDNLISQYEEYIEGIEYPSNSKLGRMIQRKTLKLLDKIGGYSSKRNQSEEVLDKIVDIGYRFELRVMVYTKNKNRLVDFKHELSETLKEMNFFNELAFAEVKNKKKFIDDFNKRRLCDYSMNQMISESELLCMLGDNEMVIEKQVSEREVKTPTKMKSPLSIINLLPDGEKLDREIDNAIVNELPIALNKAKAIKTPHIEVLGVELGATVQRITFKIPDGIVYSDIKHKHEDIEATLGYDVNIIKGNEPNTITFLIPCSQRDIIYLKELMSDSKFIKFAEENPLPFICGVDMYNQPVYKCLTKAPHLLIAGGTNSGKSVFMVATLLTFILLKNPQELRLFLIDPKKVEFPLFKGLAHVEDVILDMDKAYKTLDGLINEMENRYDQMSKVEVKNIVSYNKKNEGKMPYIVCAIDEYNDLKTVYPEVEELIERLGQKARGAGIHLLLATQSPNADVISKVLKANLPGRISFKLDNANEYRTVFGTGIPYRNLLGFGDGVVKYVGQTQEFVRFQAPVITLDDNEEEALFDKLKNRYKDKITTKDEIKDEQESVKEEPIDKLKRIISTTGETRVGELRKEMGIRINVVQELVYQLTEEGFLEKDGRGYKIVASEDELVKWKSQ